MSLVRIREAKPMGGHRVQFTLTDGRMIERDLDPMLVGPVFSEIRSDPARFREMRVEGGTLVWSNGADVRPDVLIWGGLPPAETTSDAA
ncbi:MAG: DUF2442 domain-containing protein [Acidobacteriota bacterium]|nr:DUF2442 domain-containing protein [Acidobacteriota bacterium]